MFRYRLVRFAVNITRLLLLARFKVVGRGNIPAQGSYIVVLNHTSVVDTPVLFLNFPPQEWRFFAVEKWRAHPIYGPIMGWMGAIYIKRDSIDRQQLREAMTAIQSGMAFGLAPEGSRSPTGKMMAAKDGAAYLASKAGVPILPVGLVNTDRLITNVKRLRSTEIEIRVGEPFTLPDLGRRARSRDLPAFTHLIMAHIAAQLPERYHGHYTDSPALAALLAGEDAWPAAQRSG